MANFLEEEHDSQIVLTEKEGIFYLTIPELGLLVKGNDISALYQEINDQKKALLNEYKNIGFSYKLKSFPEPGKSKVLFSDIARFIFKSAVVTLLVVVIFLTTISFTFAKAANLFSPYNVRTFTHIIVSRLEQIPPEKMENYKVMVRRYVTAVKPLVDELRPLLEGSLEEQSPSKLRTNSKSDKIFSGQ
jgi:hypothetical protein